MALSNRLMLRHAVEEELTLTEDNIAILQSSIYDIRQKMNETIALPPDVMIEIFQEVLEENAGTDTAEYGCTTQPFQFTLGAVSRTWRNVAWGFPALWKNFRFTFNETRADVQLELVQEWIQRTGGLPLDLSLYLISTEEIHPTLDCILRLLLFECTRWRSLAISGEATHQLRTEMLESGYSFPLLYSISFGLGSDCRKPDEEETWTFTNSTGLRSLTLDEGISWDKSELGLNWATIEEFTYVGGVAEGQQLLAAMPSVRSTHIAFSDAEVVDTPLLLPVLETLSLGDEANGEYLTADSLMSQLNFPSLTTLTIHLPSDDIELSILTNAIRRSNCSLLELTLYDLLLYEASELVDLFRATPSLVKLDLRLVPESQCELGDEVVDALNPPNPQPATQLPCLPHITDVVYRGPISFSPQKMSAFLRCRSRPESTSLRQLKSFSIHCPSLDWPQSVDANALRRFYVDAYGLKPAGTSFEIVYDSEDGDVQS